MAPSRVLGCRVLAMLGIRRRKRMAVSPSTSARRHNRRQACAVPPHNDILDANYSAHGERPPHWRHRLQIFLYPVEITEIKKKNYIGLSHNCVRKWRYSNWCMYRTHYLAYCGAGALSFFFLRNAGGQLVCALPSSLRWVHHYFFFLHTILCTTKSKGPQPTNYPAHPEKKKKNPAPPFVFYCCLFVCLFFSGFLFVWFFLSSFLFILFFPFIFWFFFFSSPVRVL